MGVREQSWGRLTGGKVGGMMLAIGPSGRGLFVGFVSVLLIVCVCGICLGQLAVGGGRGLDANRRVGSGGLNTGVNRGFNSAYGNQIISGNVGAGMSFQGVGGIRDPRAFQAGLGSSSLSNFQRDSYGLNNNAAGAGAGAAQPFYLPSSTVLGIQDIAGGRAKTGSNMPSSANLIPKTPVGQYLGEGRKSSKFGVSGTVDGRLDMRARVRSLPLIAGGPTVERASNLLGVGRRSPELGLERPYDEVVKEIVAKRQMEEESARRSTKRSFQALPAWAQPVMESGGGQEGREGGSPGLVGQPSGMSEQMAKNLAESREVLEQSQGKLGVPNLVDIYEQMMAERAADEQREVVAQEVTPKTIGLPDLYVGNEEDKIRDQKLLESIQVYSTFVSRRRTSFNDYMARGEAMLKTRSYYQASQAYEGAISLERMNPLGYLGRAYSLAGAGELVSASESLGQALAIFPEQAGTKIDLRGFFASQEEIDRITGKLVKLAEFKEGDARVRLLLGYMYHYSGKRDLAVPVLQEAAALAKTDASVPAELAEIIGKFAEAVSKQAEVGSSWDIGRPLVPGMNLSPDAKLDLGSPPGIESPSGLDMNLTPGLELDSGPSLKIDLPPGME